VAEPDRAGRGVSGDAPEGCVEGTGRWGIELGYSVTLVKDATASFSTEWMDAAV
jgi:nicotinamidase-related amidase